MGLPWLEELAGLPEVEEVGVGFHPEGVRDHLDLLSFHEASFATVLAARVGQRSEWFRFWSAPQN